MSYDYTNKIIELFENKQKLKDAVIKDLEVNAIVNTLIMTIAEIFGFKHTEYFVKLGIHIC